MSSQAVSMAFFLLICNELWVKTQTPRRALSPTAFAQYLLVSTDPITACVTHHGCEGQTRPLPAARSYARHAALLNAVFTPASPRIDIQQILYGCFVEATSDVFAPMVAKMKWTQEITRYN
jgi:hypothetical protein